MEFEGSRASLRPKQKLKICFFQVCHLKTKNRLHPTRIGIIHDNCLDDSLFSIVLVLAMGLLKIIRKTKKSEREMRILMLGLDNAGKTTILMSFCGYDMRFCFLYSLSGNR